ncbi:peptide ABC transporter ATP-binding protein [Pectobacterium betavasculorum]|uniref:Peptide ABC transporter ATP-binding protein n=1 Tax=Pectobacterium betavasculorum TaxID=55207 RepID=A0A093RLT0_9GAMM|nr:dipeptide/oligopeptide/nickel ABC transporter ATP-binding protein [Pectobacterium betavasculorum]KFX04082.1 peptide ABC transporter ATP-binding protein [Pectobacterium betavasculorum]KFX20116.1 peptide ABC transporter ATP-binding protein [Pectobacterium betavasculorum]
MAVLVDVAQLSHGYLAENDGKWRPVLHDISFHVRLGECLGIIGESGSGKSTLGRLLLGLETPNSGCVTLAGLPIGTPRRFWSCRRHAQPRVSAVFQDYTSSANPAMTIREIVAEPLRVRGVTRREDIRLQVAALLEQVGLASDLSERFPHQLSGGQMQRVCIARAIACQPAFIVLDEAVSALDVSVQLQVLDLLVELRERLGLTYLFISHDLAAIAYLCQRVIFLQSGRIIERVDDMKLLGQVQHPYAQKLLQSVMTF